MKRATDQAIQQGKSRTDRPESEDEEELIDGLTKTQRSKLKKRELEAKERAGSVMPPPPPTTEEEEQGVERGEFKEGRPDETWPEVGKWAQSVRDLKPICELTISRESDGQDSRHRRSAVPISRIPRR